MSCLIVHELCLKGSEADMACSMQSKLTFPSPGSDDGHALSVTLGSMGVWASQRRLCLAANLLLLARQEAAKLGVSDGHTNRRAKVGKYSRWLSSASFICHESPSPHSLFTVICLISRIISADVIVYTQSCCRHVAPCHDAPQMIWCTTHTLCVPGHRANTQAQTCQWVR